MQINNITKQYWTEEDILAVQAAKDFKELYFIAQRVLNRMPQPVVQVCGPIGTGGLGNVEDNLNAFDSTIKNLQNKGLNVFDQMPFEWPMQVIKMKVDLNKYPEAILYDFYEPLFKSGLIKECYFMNNWQTSKGANWEHDQAKKLGIKINYL
jgi:hypothetical protein